MNHTECFLVRINQIRNEIYLTSFSVVLMNIYVFGTVFEAKLYCIGRPQFGN